ncbi:hypothetical protein R6Q59_036839 [Mikania micrantha]
MGRRLWCIREKDAEFDYEIIYDENVKPQADANVDAQENETETEDDDILDTQEPEGI